MYIAIKDATNKQLMIVADISKTERVGRIKVNKVLFLNSSVIECLVVSNPSKML